MSVPMNALQTALSDRPRL